MILKQYKTPNGSWLGWVEDLAGGLIAFVDVSGKFVFGDWSN